MIKRRDSKTPGPHQLPPRYRQFQKKYARVFQAFDSLGAALQNAGPLDAHTRALVKLALAVGAALEGGVHSHTRRAVESGCAPDEIRHVVLLAITTLGFPATMAALSWVEDVLEQ